MGRFPKVGIRRCLAAGPAFALLVIAACGPRETTGSAPEPEQARGAAQSVPQASSPATRNSAPRILAQPQNTITREGEAIVLKVTADAIPAPTYQWSKDGRDVPGATAATYRVANARASDAGLYQVTVANDSGSVISDRAGVIVETVGQAPVITSPPLDLAVNQGSQAFLKVIAAGTPPLSYLWAKEGRPGFVSNEAELFIGNAKPEDAGTYTVEVSNRYGKATAFCRLTVNPIYGIGVSFSAGNRLPRILTQPQNVMAYENDSIVLQVTADSMPLPSYQWSKDGADILGATEATYRVPRARGTDAGTYRVAVTNSAGTTLSNPAVVTVLGSIGSPPLITNPPQDLTVVEGNQVSFRVSATGTAPLSYVWSKEGRAGFLSNEAQMFLASAGPGDSGTYMVEVSNQYGKATAFCRLAVNPR